MRIRVALTAVALAAASTLLGAGPASADHYSGLESNGKCYLGRDTPVIAAFTDTVVGVRQHKGVTTGFTCIFKDIPERVEYAPGWVWELPDRAVVYDGAWCNRPEDIANPSGTGRLIVTPSGRGVLTCSFPRELLPTG